MARTDYNVKITEMSNNYTNLSKKELIALKDMNDCIRIDQYATDGLVVKVVGFVVLSIHNEHARENQDYNVFKMVGDDGNTYITSSKSLTDQFIDLWEEINEGEDYPQPLDIKIFAKESKNYSGKSFFTCRLI